MGRAEQGGDENIGADGAKIAEELTGIEKSEFAGVTASGVGKSEWTEATALGVEKSEWT